MKITVTFDSLEEFWENTKLPEEYSLKLLKGLSNANKQLIEEGTSGPQAATKKPETKKSTPKAEKSEEEPAEKSEEVSEETEAPAEVTEDFRVEVRKTLAKLNKKVGKNMASELIKEFGVEKLTEVSLSDLPALMDKAKEALNAK